MDLRDAEDQRFGRRDIARNDGLQLADQGRGDNNRVFRLLRHGAVAARAANVEVEEIGARHGFARFDTDLFRLSIGVVVHPVDFVAGEAPKQVVGQHGAGAAQAFLGRLEDEDCGSGEVLGFRQIPRGAQQHGRMGVMAAGVHDARRLRGEGQVGALVNRQGVHIGAQTDAPPVAFVAFQDADDAGFPDAGVGLDPPGLQHLGNLGRGADLLHPQFGMFVKVAADRHEVVGESGDAVDDGHGKSPVAGLGQSKAPIRVPGKWWAAG